MVTEKFAVTEHHIYVVSTVLEKETGEKEIQLVLEPDRVFSLFVLCLDSSRFPDYFGVTTVDGLTVVLDVQASDPGALKAMHVCGLEEKKKPRGDQDKKT